MCLKSCVWAPQLEAEVGWSLLMGRELGAPCTTGTVPYAPLQLFRLWHQLHASPPAYAHAIIRSRGAGAD